MDAELTHKMQVYVFVCHKYTDLYITVYAFCLSLSLVKVDVQLASLVLAAHHEWLLQSLDILSIQVLAPLTVVLPHHVIQNLDHLAIGQDHLLAAV